MNIMQVTDNKSARFCPQIRANAIVWQKPDTVYATRWQEEGAPAA